MSFVGCVGRDRFGDAALRLWRSEGVESTHVRRSASHTGLGFVIVDRKGANAISVDPGANSDLQESDVGRALAGSSRGSVLLLQLEVPVKTVNAAIRLGSRRGMVVILNPAPSTTGSPLDLRRVDVLTPNASEFSTLAGTPDLRRGTRKLLGKGVGATIVTLGERGAFVREHGESYLLRPPRVKVVDTTGAGDAFNGALAVALAEGSNVRAAVEFANAAGALTVAKREVIPALPPRSQVDSLLRKMQD